MAPENISLNYRIEPAWEVLETIRNHIESRLPGFRKRMVDACIMAVSELLENAIKYGHSKQEKTGVELRFRIEKGNVNIAVSNPVKSEADYLELDRHIEQIRQAADLQNLFVARMQSFIEDESRETKSRLGLIRIANEGGFELDCRLEDGVLTVTAVSGGADPLKYKDELDE